MGVPVVDGGGRFRIAAPVIDRPLAGGRGHVIADRDRAIVRADAAGTFYIEHGSEIRFEAEPEADPATVTTWLHGSVSALLLAQRGNFALHASTVEIGGVAVAVSGPSRAGKSTTALRLEQRGHTLVADDVSPVIGSNPAVVHPFRRPIHLYAQTAEALGIDVSEATGVLPTHPKLALPMPSRDPVELGAIVVLRPADPRAPVRAERVRGADAYWEVERNLYRTEILVGLYPAAMFTWTAALAGAVPVHYVERPPGEWTVDQVAEAVEDIASAARCSNQRR